MKKTPLAVVLSLALASAYALALGQTASAKRAANASPEFVGGPWINTKDGKPVTLESRLGKPTLVAFWTFGCSNCQANLKPYARLLARYRPKGVELLSVHTPELKIERDVVEVKKHVQKYGIDYPVLIDGANANWDRWKIRYWPTLLLLDGKGRTVRYWEGELNWQGADGEGEVAKALDALLANR